MKIAQIAPLYESVPPRLYGGTERVVSYLTEELVAQGHDVTLFASGDSVTEARLIPPRPQALRLDTRCVDQLAHHILMLEQVFKEAEDFDIIHFHVDYLHFPWSRQHSHVNVTTLHGRLDIPDLVPLYREFLEMPVVSISQTQREPLPWLNWRGTVHHGLPPSLYKFHSEPGEYLAFLGRISPEKGVDRAIEIAKKAGLQLRIAAKVDRADEEYFEQAIRPLLDHPLIDFVGEVSDAEKDAFLGHASALLMPVNWEEPFGLVMIEALACGTPIVAYQRGSVPEVIEDGVTGRIVHSVEQAVGAVARISDLSRKRCRRVFEERFTAPRMVADYVAIYERLIEDPTGEKAFSSERPFWTTTSSA